MLGFTSRLPCHTMQFNVFGLTLNRLYFILLALCQRRGLFCYSKLKWTTVLLSQYSPPSRQHHRRLSLCRVFESRCESDVPPEDRLYPQSRGTRMTSACPLQTRSLPMNLPASLWLVNSSPQIKPLINALLVMFTTTPWRQVQEYVSHHFIQSWWKLQPGQEFSLQGRVG